MFGTVMGVILANILFLALHLESRVLPEPLTPKQEREEFEKYFNGDTQARDKLIKHNLRLVAHVVKRYYQGPVEQDDLMSIGTIGLIKAVQSFKNEKNVRFSTYASKCINNEVLMTMRKVKQQENVVSLEESIDTENKSEKLTLKDSLPDSFDMESHCQTEELKTCVQRLVVDNLCGRERQIIILRYGLFGNSPQTQQQICQLLGISRSYVSRIEKRAMDILREKVYSEINN